MVDPHYLNKKYKRMIPGAGTRYHEFYFIKIMRTQWMQILTKIECWQLYKEEKQIESEVADELYGIS
jgi:hypothetical protein